MHIHSHPPESPSPALDPDIEGRHSELPSLRPFDLLNYRIHIGWFGGLRIYSIADTGESYEHRETSHS
ncbi:MAG: hypothetical protein AAF921_15710 [Cyanobacteria bacterium P01_D01_bin.44]